jgi:LAS superfamily LD-carboxypeptidase LdcB
MRQSAILLTLITLLILACSKQEESTPVSPQEERMQQSPKTNVGEEKARFVTGQFEPSEHPDFVRIEAEYTEKENIFMQREAYESFKELHRAASADGIKLTILSAARNFDYQKKIWENKWSGKTLVDGKDNMAEKYPEPKDRAVAILEYSSMPGTSRHHWGTDIDLNALNNAYFESGEGKKVYEWLTANASTYGFCQPYTEKNADRPWGYNEEKWHWSYQPLASKFLSTANVRIHNDEMTGFSGAELAEELLIKEKYILGVNKACK